MRINVNTKVASVFMRDQLKRFFLKTVSWPLLFYFFSVYAGNNELEVYLHVAIPAIFVILGFFISLSTSLFVRSFPKEILIENKGLTIKSFSFLFFRSKSYSFKFNEISYHKKYFDTKIGLMI